jgi:SAM-dependent methyltransferase
MLDRSDMPRAASSSVEEGALRRLRDLDPRPPLWDRSALVPRDCPFCGSLGKPHAERPDGLTVCLCPLCAAAFLSPAPAADEVARFYRGYRGRHRVEAFADTPYAHRAEIPTTAEPERLASRIRARRALDDFRVQALASHLKLAGARVMDLGCGVGQLLHGLRSLGAQVEGIDPDPEAVEFARTALGLDGVRQGTHADVHEAARFDLVVLQDVLEHVLDPSALFAKGADLLAPGGFLYLWTPNASFVSEQDQPLVLRGDYEHLQFASTRTVLRLAADHALEPVHLECTGFLGSLEDAAHTPGGSPSRNAALRARLKRIPGLRQLIALRSALRRYRPARSGTYHLFALLRGRGADPLPGSGPTARS